ncbi:MAG TPA: signal peptidase I, partial [Spirochaetota bacterium]|nr:signal peptidase I [Spirochaetota bacterium]
SNLFLHYDNNIYIKRVVGIPGDVIKYSIINGKVVVLINGIPEKKVIEDNYTLIEETEKNSPLISSMILQKEFVVKEGEFYVLGDNRIQSFDSRVFGSISQRQIIGKGIIKYWPLKEFGIIK